MNRTYRVLNVIFFFKGEIFMKINYKVNFEISSSEVKDLILNLAEGFIKVQEWKSGHDKSTKQSSISESIRRKDEFNRRREQRMAELDRRHKQTMAEIDRQHKQHMKDLHKKMEEVFNKKTTDIDISTLPDDVKRQIALDYLKKHPLPEDKQKQVADEYIRKYGVIK